MNSKYKVLKYKSNNAKNIDDLISIEEPLEITIKFKNKEVWNENIISITMRTPGNDEDLVRGFLFNERIIEKIEYIDKIESVGENVGQYSLKNKIIATINNSENVDIDKIKRNFSPKFHAVLKPCIPAPIIRYFAFDGSLLMI